MRTLTGSLRRRRAAVAPRDPAPSRLAYRWQRIWLTPHWRAAFRVGLPAFAVVAGIGLYLADEGRRDAITDGFATLRTSIEQRPEFMVNVMAIDGASPALAEAVRAAMAVDLPASSFDLDLEALRLRAAALDAVASADVRIRPGGILAVDLTERIPAVLWRGEDGLWSLDATGHRVGRIASRLDRPDLPVIAGLGADKAVPEALALLAAAQPVAPRLRGLVRMGARRWDVVLDRGQRILLPQHDPVEALERAMALAIAEDMLERDVSVIDFRNAERPTLRLGPEALQTLRDRRAEPATGATNG